MVTKKIKFVNEELNVLTSARLVMHYASEFGKDLNDFLSKMMAFAKIFDGKKVNELDITSIDFKLLSEAIEVSFTMIKFANEKYKNISYEEWLDLYELMDLKIASLTTAIQLVQSTKMINEQKTEFKKKKKLKGR